MVGYKILSWGLEMPTDLHFVCTPSHELRKYV